MNAPSDRSSSRSCSSSRRAASARARSGLRAAALLAGVAILAGCPAPRLPPVPRAYPPPSVAEVLAHLEARQRTVESLRAEAKVESSDGTNDRVKLTMGILAARGG